MRAKLNHWHFEVRKIYALAAMLSPAERAAFDMDIDSLEWPLQGQLYAYGIARFMQLNDIESPLSNMRSIVQLAGAGFAHDAWLALSREYKLAGDSLPALGVSKRLLTPFIYAANKLLRTRSRGLFIDQKGMAALKYKVV